METRKQQAAQAPQDLAAWLAPFAGWEAVSRWNQSNFDWMATSWQQWLALMTTVPPHFLVEVSPPAVPARSVTPVSSEAALRAAARPEPKRPATKKKSAAQGRKRG